MTILGNWSHVRFGAGECRGVARQLARWRDNQRELQGIVNLLDCKAGLT